MPIGGAEEREQLEAAARTLDAVTAAATREFTDAAELVAAFLCESVPAPAGPSAEGGGGLGEEGGSASLTRGTAPEIELPSWCVCCQR